MTARTARWIGGFAALVLGAVLLDLNPPLGILEIVAAIAVLTTHRRAAALVAVLPTGLILAAEILGMRVSGANDPIVWSIAVAAGVTAVTLVRGGVVTKAERPILQ
jgi:hypothetical protein